MLTAMKYATFARFAYVYLNDLSTEIVQMRRALDVTCFKCENILIFNDFPQVSLNSWNLLFWEEGNWISFYCFNTRINLHFE